MSTLISRGEAPTTGVVMGEVAGRQIKNTSYSGFERTELDLPDDDYAGFRKRAIENVTDDGVKPMTPEELAAERELSWVLVKKFTQSIFSMDFTRFSFPVGYSEQRSFLERTADLFTFIGDLYAEKMLETTVPETRLNLLTAGIVAGFHIYLASKKPWNPVLGETYVGRWPNGATIYAEQTSHHPPISDFQIIGPNNSWKCHAHCNFTISSGMLQVDVYQKGVFKLELPDGTRYEWEFPTISVYGVIKGERYVCVKGPLTVTDVTNDMKTVVEIAPKADKKKGIAKQRYTQIYGGIVKGNDYSPVMTGDYCDSVQVDGQELWNINKDIAHRPIAPVPDDELLLSDCRFRLDRMYLIKGDLDTADNVKVIIEESQRREEKMRDCVPKPEEEQKPSKGRFGLGLFGL